MSHTKSPAVITATYRGKDLINGGETLPAIEVSGVLTKDAIPSLTNVVRVHTGCNCKINNDKATDTICVKKASYGQECKTCCHKKKCNEEDNKDKSKNSSQENTSTTNTANSTPAPTNTAANAVSAVAITSVNINNIYGANGVGTLPAFSSGSISGSNGNAEITSGPSSVGDVPGLPNTAPGLPNTAPGLPNTAPGLPNTAPGLSNTVPGLPNTGSDPRGSLTASPKNSYQPH